MTAQRAPAEHDGTSRAGRATALLHHVGTSAWVAMAIGAVQGIVASVAVVQDTFLNNEGIFTHVFARMAADDPLTTLFFLKARPPLAAFYAAPSALGFDAFAILHAWVAAAAAPLTAALARALGHEWPNVSAALVASSSLLLAAAASGVGNSDGMTLGVLAAALLFAWDRPALAGVVATIGVLARAEAALLAIALGAHVLIAGGRARYRFLIGLFASGLGYAALGALYHRDPIWFLHFPPHVTHSVPFSEIVGRELFGGEPHVVTLTLITLLPALGLLAFIRPAKLSRPEQTLGVFLVVFIGILSAAPALHPLNFGDMPRYLLPALPFLALLSGRALEPLSRSPGLERSPWRIGVGVLAALALLGHAQDAAHRAPALLWAVAGWSLVALVSATSLRRWIPGLVVVLSLAAGYASTAATRLTVNRDTLVLGQRLVDHAPPDVIVLTNVAELPLWLARNGGGQVDVRHLMAADMRYEIDTLANEAVGQEQALHALIREHWYGPVVFPEEVREMIRPGTWLALRDDPRTTHILDEAWLEGSDTIDLGRGLRIVEVRAP